MADKIEMEAEDKGSGERDMRKDEDGEIVFSSY